MHWFRTAIALILVASICIQSDAVDLKRQSRRPVAIVLSGNGQLVFTANQSSGSISVIDTSTRSVVEETNVGGRLSDLAALDDTKLLALNQQNHQLCCLRAAELIGM